jgi:multidrug efflux pump subunit AcrB
LLTAASAAIGGALAWWHWRGPWLAAVAILTTTLLTIAVLLPRVYAPVFAFLDGLMRKLLQAFTWLILGCVFLLVFVPGRLVLALRRQDPLARRPEPARATYWHDIARTTRDTAAQFRTQY